MIRAVKLPSVTIKKKEKLQTMSKYKTAPVQPKSRKCSFTLILFLTKKSANVFFLIYVYKKPLMYTFEKGYVYQGSVCEKLLFQINSNKLLTNHIILLNLTFHSFFNNIPNTI